jgi:hypothetical protein
LINWNTNATRRLAALILTQHDATRGFGQLDSRGPVVVKNTAADLGEYIARSGLERSLDIRTALRASLDEQKSFLLCPSRTFVRGHLPPILREIALIAYEYAREMRICVRAYIR